MLESVKSFWRDRVLYPLSIVFRPVRKLFRIVLQPVADVLRPSKDRFDERWANFTLRNPRAATWLRRGGKLAAFFYACYFIFAIGLFGEMPTVEALKDMQTLNTSEVFTADSVLIGKFYKENRKDISFTDLPQHLVDALVSTEDARYWSHSGVDFRAFGRVLVKSVLGGDESSGGGSTLSQQLAKNLFPRKKYFAFSTPINKVREMLIARRLERAYDKKNLLSFYLNTVPFGGNVFGVEMASKRFFNKPAKELKLEEAAVIVGMLQKNTGYNPKKNPEASRKRRNEVLAKLVKAGKLDPKVLDKLKDDSIRLNYQPVLNRDAMAPHFKDYIRTIVPKILEAYKKSDGSTYDIYKDGLKIYTSLDAQMQRMAEAAVEKRMSELQRKFDDHWSGSGKWWGDDRWLEDAMRKSDRWKKLAAEGWNEKRIRNHFLNTKLPMNIFMWENGKPSEDESNLTPLDSIKYYFRQLNTGFMALDHKTGLIKAWVGGTDFTFFQYDHARARRQVGSTFKPIVYAAALQAGVRPCEYTSNALTAYLENGETKSGWGLTEKEKEKAWVPRNSDESYSGAYSLEGALTNSVNVVTAQLIKRIGYPAVQGLAKKMGVSSEMQPDLSIALGTTDISLLDMIKVYGTFATRGKRPEPVVVLKITTRDGEIIADFSKQNEADKWEQVLSPDHADMMTKMMKSVVSDGTAERMQSTYNINSDLAGKTGTTQNNSDGWFMCFTPNLVLGTWVGGTTPAVRFRDMNYGQGAYMALPICGIFLKNLYETPRFAKLKEQKFQSPQKWVLDSMECSPRMYFDDGDDEDDSLTTDSLQVILPIPAEPNKIDANDDGKGNPKPPTTPAKPGDEDGDHDLRTPVAPITAVKTSEKKKEPSDEKTKNKPQPALTPQPDKQRQQEQNKRGNNN
jgi:penicillin-binding protein 1A